MAVMRYDPTVHDWVLFAPERGRRPRELEVGEPAASPPESCPFCPGHEEATPDETLRVPDEAGTGWSVRAFPNRFAALERSGGAGIRGTPLFQEATGYGFHEVLVESPEHRTLLAHQPARQVEKVLGALLERARALALDPSIGAVLVFKNHGEGAGTSIRHPHWQIVATSVVPRRHRLRLFAAQDYFDRTGRCLYDDLRDGELEDGSRVVSGNAAFAAIAPYASRVPFQVRIMPRRHSASFLNLPESDLPDLAAVLRDVLGRLHAALRDPPFNLTLTSAPVGDERMKYFLWHIDVLPRLSTPAGFELGSGMSINTVLPEAAAESLRRAASQGGNEHG